MWYYDMEKHTSMEDLCGTVCQPLTAYVKFVWVDDMISFILLKRGLSCQWHGHPWCRENCVSEANNFYLLPFAGVPSLTSSPHMDDFSKQYRVNGKSFVFEKYPILFLQFLRGRTVLKQHETTTKDTFPCWKTKSRINVQHQYWKIKAKRERSKVK